MGGIWRRDASGTTGSALVVVGEERIALATVLVLQEMNIAVDVVMDGHAAVRWARRARYDFIVCGPGGDAATKLALSFRIASPAARIVLLAGPRETPKPLDVFDIEVVRPPLDVNTLMWQFWPAAA